MMDEYWVSLSVRGDDKATISAQTKLGIPLKMRLKRLRRLKTQLQAHPW